MGNFFGDVGRSRAVPDLLNRLRQSRQDIGTEKLAEATEIRAEAGETRAQESHVSSQETAGLTRDKVRQEMNIQANKEKELEVQRQRLNKVKTFEEIKKRDPFTAEMMLNSGNVQVVNGEQVVTGRDAANFYQSVGKTPKFKEDRIQFAKEQTDQQVKALDQQLAEMKPTDKARAEVQAQRDELAQQGDTYREMQVAMRDATVEQAKTFTGESLEKYRQSGNLQDLVKRESDAVKKARLEGGKGKGLKAADENVIRNTVAGFFGGHFDPVSGSFKGIKGDEKKVAAVQERAAKLRRSGDMTSIEAATQAAREFGIDVEKVGAGGKTKELDAAGAKKFLEQAGGDSAKARELAKADGFTF